MRSCTISNCIYHPKCVKMIYNCFKSSLILQAMEERGLVDQRVLEEWMSVDQIMEQVGRNITRWNRKHPFVGGGCGDDR